MTDNGQDMAAVFDIHQEKEAPIFIGEVGSSVTREASSWDKGQARQAVTDKAL